MTSTSSRAGFSIFEVLIVIAIAASIVLVVGNFSNNTTALNSLVSQQLQSKSDAAVMLQMAADEVRSMAQSANGAYPIDTAGTSTFIFYSDINKNGTAERVRYFLASSSIFKGVISPTGSPAVYPTSTEAVTDALDNVTVTTSTPLFVYYDSSYTGSQAPLVQPVTIASIRLVGISFTAITNASKANVPQFFSSLIDIRNLKSN